MPVHQVKRQHLKTKVDELEQAGETVVQVTVDPPFGFVILTATPDPVDAEWRARFEDWKASDDEWKARG